MNDHHTRHVFAGIDAHSGSADVPDAYVDHAGTRPTTRFKPVLDDLTERFGIVTRPTGYRDGDTGEYVTDGRYLALVNPAWEGDGRDAAPQDTALWHIATDSYTPADPTDTYGPLTAVARAADHAGVFGRFLTYRNGGDWAVDLFFDDITVDGPDGNGERFVLGFESSADYYGRSSLKGQVIAFDTASGAVLRGLSAAYSTPHRGDAPDRLATWFNEMVGRIERLSDTLYGVVAEATEAELDVAATPYDLVDWYVAAGFPRSLAENAARDVKRSTRRPQKPTAWAAYLAMASTLTDHYDGKRGGRRIRDHAARTNELLFAPRSVERDVLEAARNDLRAQSSLDDDEERAVRVVDAKLDTLDERVGEFRSARDRIRSMLDQLDDDEELEVTA